MTVLESAKARHSVRKFTRKLLTPVILAQLQYEIDLCNKEYGLHMQIVTDAPEVFACDSAAEAGFVEARHYIALVGKRGASNLENLGRCGERVALKAQRIGLNTCWVGKTYHKKLCRVRLNPGEKLAAVIAFGYGASKGSPHRNKKMKKLYKATEPIPEWFLDGIRYAKLAPTPANQQKFRFILGKGQSVACKTSGCFKHLQRGILKYHFELGAGAEHFTWK